MPNQNLIKLRLEERRHFLEQMQRRNDLAEYSLTISEEHLQVRRKILAISKQSLCSVKEQNRMTRLLLAKVQRLETVLLKLDDSTKQLEFEFNRFNNV